MSHSMGCRTWNRMSPYHVWVVFAWVVVLVCCSSMRPVTLMTVVDGEVVSFASETNPSVVHGSGYAMFFDGTKSNSFIQISPSCAGGNSGSGVNQTQLEIALEMNSLPVNDLNGGRPNRTMMAWIRVPANLKAPGNMAIVGSPYGKGSSLFLGPVNGIISINASPSIKGKRTCKPTNTTHWNGVPYETPINQFYDGRWHHVAMSQSIDNYELYVDGQIIDSCITDRSTMSVISNPTSVVNIGVGLDQFGSGDSNSFPGYMDEIRLFAAYYPPNQIKSLMHRGWLTDEEKSAIQVWFTFDDAGTNSPIENLVWDYSGNGNHGYMGGSSATDTLKLRWPSYTAANTIHDPANTDAHYAGNPVSIYLTNAPVAGRQKTIRSKQIVTSPITISDNDIKIDFEPLDPVLYANNLFTLTNFTTISNQPHGELFVSGQLNQPLDVSQATINIRGVSLTYRPLLGESGNVLSFTVVPGDALVNATSFVVQIILVPNSAPTAGGSGGAIFCDGVNDYAFNPDFVWPMMTVELPDGSVRTGGSPSTVELWAMVTKEGEGDTGLWSIGNSEGSTDWLDYFNPYRQQGDFHARLPYADGSTDMWINQQSIGAKVQIYYHGWNHFAYAHDQVNGTGAWIYINGELAAYGTHDHHSVGGTPGYAIKDQTRVQSISLCTWSYWSEVYNRAYVDEFRVWNHVRSQDEIKRDMHKEMTGGEPGLVGYWNFNDIDAVSPPAGGRGDARAFHDVTGRGHDLWMGGCAPCDPVDKYHRGWMPYDPAHGVLPPANISDQDPGGEGYRVCLPSAKSFESPSFQVGIVYGATSHCFGTMAQSDPNNYPQRVISTAPIGGHHFQQLAEQNQEIVIQLNATDPNQLDDLRFYIESVPAYSTLQYTLDGGQTYLPVLANSFLPPFVKAMTFQPNLGYGGAPFGQIVYKVSDGQVFSEPATIQIYVQCPRGTYIDSVTHQCQNCTIGHYQSVDSLNTACLPCGRHEYQDEIGSLSCKACERGKAYQPNTGSSACLSCDDLVISTDESSSGSGLTIMANDYQCHTALPRLIDTARSDSSILFVDLLNQTTLDVFDSSKPIMASIASLPQFGELYQGKIAEISPLGTSSTPSSTQARTTPRSLRFDATSSSPAVGTSLKDPFFSLATPSIQYASSVIGSAPSLAGHDISQILGAPNVLKYGTSPQAWSPVKQLDGSDQVAVVLQFTNAMYIQSLTVYETNHPGGIISMEGWNPSTATWFPFWYLSSDDLATASSTSSTIPAGIRKFTPKESCPTLFLCNRIRVTWQFSLVGGAIEVDAISMNGVTARNQLGSAWVDGPVIAYESPTSDQVPITQPYQDSFSYVIRDCSSNPKTIRNAIQLSFPSQPLPIFQPNQGLQKAIYALSGINIVLVLFVIVIVFLYRNAVIIRSSNFLFCLVTLFFHLPLPIGAIFYALQPNQGEYICHTRPWLTAIGVVGILAALITKTNQNRMIFNNTKLTTLVLSRMRLLTITGAMVGMEMVLLIILSALPLTNPILVPGSGKSNGFMVWQCSATSGHSTDLGSPSFISDLSFNIWLGIQFAYVFIFLVSVCYMAFSVRNIPQAFNEASSILVCVFALAFFLVILIPLQFLIDDDVNALILIRGIGQNFCCSVLILALFGPKLYYIKIGKANDKTMQQTQKTKAFETGTGTHSHTPPALGGGAKVKNSTIRTSPAPSKVKTLNGPQPLPKTATPLAKPMTHSPSISGRPIQTKEVNVELAELNLMSSPGVAALPSPAVVVQDELTASPSQDQHNETAGEATTTTTVPSTLSTSNPTVTAATSIPPIESTTKPAKLPIRFHLAKKPSMES